MCRSGTVRTVDRDLGDIRLLAILGAPGLTGTGRNVCVSSTDDASVPTETLVISRMG